MILQRRGVSALVPAGTPYVPRQAPLVPTIIQTIAGVEREGGRYGVTANPVFPPLIGRGPRFQRGMGGRGLRGTPQMTLVNLTTGKSYPAGLPPVVGSSNPNDPPIFKTGDRYQLVVSGADPGAGIIGSVTLNGNFPGYAGQTDPGMSIWLGYKTTNLVNIGTADEAGNWSMSGTFTDAMSGSWYMAWIVGTYRGASTSFVFNAANSQGVVSTAPVNMDLGQANYQLAANQVPTQQAPTATVQTLAQQLAAAGLVMSPSGQLVTPAAAAAEAAASASTRSIQGTGTLRLTNLTSGNASSFQVGDKWQISITGASPNKPVIVTGTQNGKTSTTPMGTTDASGNWAITGTMDASTVGSWSEQWSVGGVVIGQLSFTVGAAASSSGSGSGAGGGAATPQTTGGGSVANTSTGTFDIGSFLTGSAFLGLPNWMLLAAAAGAIVLIGSKK